MENHYHTSRQSDEWSALKKGGKLRKSPAENECTNSNGSAPSRWILPQKCKCTLRSKPHFDAKTERLLFLHIQTALLHFESDSVHYEWRAFNWHNSRSEQIKGSKSHTYIYNKSDVCIIFFILYMKLFYPIW